MRRQEIQCVTLYAFFAGQHIHGSELLVHLVFGPIAHWHLVVLLMDVCEAGVDDRAAHGVHNVYGVVGAGGDFAEHGAPVAEEGVE